MGPDGPDRRASARRQAAKDERRSSAETKDAGRMADARRPDRRTWEPERPTAVNSGANRREADLEPNRRGRHAGVRSGPRRHCSGRWFQPC